MLSLQQTLSLAMVALDMVMVVLAMVEPPFTVSITEPTSMVLVYRTTIHHRLLPQVQKIPRHLLSGFLLLLLSQAMGRLFPTAMLVHTGRGNLDMLEFMGILALLTLAMLKLVMVLLAMLMVMLAMPTLEHTQDTLAGHMLLLRLLRLLQLLPSLSEAAALPSLIVTSNSNNK